MALPDILQWISAGRKTGSLYIHRQHIEKRIAFESGAISTSWSNDPRESLGQFLIRGGHVSEEQLFQALLAQETEGKLLGAILIDRGHIDDAGLRAVLQTKVEETIYDLFLWPEGAFEFKDGDVPTKIATRIDAQVQSLILEGVRRIDEWERIRAVFPTMNTTFRRLAGTLPDDPAQRQSLALCERGLTIAQMCLELRRSEFDTAALLLASYNAGLLTVDRVEPEVVDPDRVGTIRDLLTAADQQMQQKDYPQALASYEQVLALDRLNQDAKKGLIAAIEARSRDRAIRSVVITKTPLVTMPFAELTRENFDPQEGFVLSRINGEWDVQSILKLCPMAEETALLIFARLLERKVIELN